MLIKFKKCHEKAQLPSQALGDVGFDLRSVENVTLKMGAVTKVKTGLQIADYNPLIRAASYDQLGPMQQNPVKLTVYPKIEGRSSLGSKGIFPVAGIIDPQYRGELIVALSNLSDSDYIVREGDKIAQFVLYSTVTMPFVSFEETDEVVETDRGDKGFGSTGR